MINSSSFTLKTTPTLPTSLNADPHNSAKTFTVEKTLTNLTSITRLTT